MGNAVLKRPQSNKRRSPCDFTVGTTRQYGTPAFSSLRTGGFDSACQILARCGRLEKCGRKFQLGKGREGLQAGIPLLYEGLQTNVGGSGQQL